MLRAVMLGSMLMVGTVAYAQTATELKGSTTPATVAVKVEDKKLPPEIAIPEARTDKAKVLVLERALLESNMEKVANQYKELKAAFEDKTAKLMAEFTSAAKAAGVEEAAMEKYEFRLDLLKMLLKKEEPKAEVKK